MPYKIVDTHVHTWDLEKAEYDWLKGDTTIINRSYSITELSEDRIHAGVTEGVIVQSANNFEDTDCMLEVAEKKDWIKGVVGWLPLPDPAKAEQAFYGKYSSNKYFKGVRHLIHNEPNHEWLLQDGVIESLQFIAKKKLTYDVVGILPEHIETLLKVAEKVPDLKMVFDHINQPPIALNERFGRWGDLMKQAAKHPNFYVKISGLGTTTKKQYDWSAHDIKPYVEFVLEQFGIDRCVCGSDWPVSLLAGSYVKTWNIYKEALSGLLNEEGQQKVLAENAIKFYDL